jgi:predicted AlkP superfamily phosphohydrolase/phosphomutase
VFHFVSAAPGEKPESGISEIVNARSIRSATLWDILGHHERKVVLVNVPMTYPPRAVNGSMITGLLTPKGASIWTYPQELSEELTDYVIDLDRFIDTKPFQSEHGHEETAPSMALMDEFRDMLEKRARVSLELMESKPWDLFMVVFTGPDRMGHYLWPYHRSPDAADPPEVQELCQAIHDYYIRLDEIIGQLVEQGGSPLSVMLMSDHGMGPNFTKRLHGNNWLRQQGWLDAQTGEAGVANLDGWLSRLRLPRDKIGRVIVRIPGLAGSRFVRKAAKSRSAAVDVRQSQAYFTPIYNNLAGVHINLSGDAKEGLCERIKQGLSELVDPDTGQPLVEKVYHGEMFYDGPFAHDAPDLVVALKPGYGWGMHVSSYSSLVTPVSLALLQGDHRPEGIFVAHGPAIVPDPEPLRGLTIEDVAPTALYLMGLPRPSDMDGRVLTEILVPETLESQPVRPGEPLGFWPAEDEVTFLDEALSDEDEADVRARLEALGYL